MLVQGAELSQVQEQLGLSHAYTRWLSGQVYRLLREALLPHLVELGVERVSPNDVHGDLTVTQLSEVLGLTGGGAYQVLMDARSDGILPTVLPRATNGHLKPSILIPKPLAQKVVLWYINRGKQ